MRKLAREKSSGRTEKVHQRINALEPEEIAFPASISVLRVGEQGAGGRAKGGDGVLARETTPGRRRRGERKRREGKGPLEFFNIPMPLHVALFFSLSFSFVLFHIITRSRKSRSRTLRNRGGDFVFLDR